MARSEWREKVRVRAVGSDGRTYTVIETAIFDEVPLAAGRSVESEGESRLRTTEGTDVFYVSKGHYTLGTTDIELRSDDPNAP